MIKRLLSILIFLIIINISIATVLDSDRDSVPDQFDKCPNTNTDIVDSFGCSCSQKIKNTCSGEWCCNLETEICRNARCVKTIADDQTDIAKTTAKFTFVVVGDTRTGHNYHRKIVNEIEKVNPQFVINTGDLVKDGGEKDDWDEFFEITSPIHKTKDDYYATRGNHDGDDSDWRTYMGHLPGNKLWYSFTYGNAKFIILDSESDYGSGSEQYKWFENELKNKNTEWVFVFFHKPPYSMG